MEMLGDISRKLDNLERKVDKLASCHCKEESGSGDHVSHEGEGNRPNPMLKP